MRVSKSPWYRASHDAWYVTINGRQVRLASGKSNQAEAWKQWLAINEAGGLAHEREQTVAQCFDHYLSTLSESSARVRRPILLAFLAHIGTARVGRLTNATVRRYIKPHWAASTTRTHIKTILAALNMAVRDKLIPANPLADVDKPAWERREEILSSADLDRLIAHAREPFRTLLVAMISTGCRPGEVCGVKVEDCRPDQGMWLVANKTKARTGRKKRPIYLTDEMVELTRRLAGDRKEGHLFINKHGRPWTPDTIRLRFRGLRRKLGLSDGAIPYGTRHRYASDAINDRKMDSLIVAKLMGHSDPVMLAKTYYREDPAAMIEAANRATGHLRLPGSDQEPVKE